MGPTFTNAIFPFRSSEISTVCQSSTATSAHNADATSWSSSWSSSSGSQNGQVDFGSLAAGTGSDQCREIVPPPRWAAVVPEWSGGLFWNMNFEAPVSRRCLRPSKDEFANIAADHAYGKRRQRPSTQRRPALSGMSSHSCIASLRQHTLSDHLHCRLEPDPRRASWQPGRHADDCSRWRHAQQLRRSTPHSADWQPASSSNDSRRRRRFCTPLFYRCAAWQQWLHDWRCRRRRGSRSPQCHRDWHLAAFVHWCGGQPSPNAGCGTQLCDCLCGSLAVYSGTNVEC